MLRTGETIRAARESTTVPVKGQSVRLAFYLVEEVRFDIFAEDCVGLHVAVFAGAAFTIPLQNKLKEAIEESPGHLPSIED